MKKTLSLALVTAITCLAAVTTAAPAASAAVPSYTGCLNQQTGRIDDVAEGHLPLRPCKVDAAEIHLSSGDLSSLAVGAGLTGGGDNGDLSVSIAPSFRLPQTCSGGQGTAWDGAAWGCAAFASDAAFNSLVALLGAPGTINDSSNPVHWTKLKGVPLGFADGDDDGTTYTGSGALSLVGNDFRLSTNGCSSGEVWKYNGSAWSCEADEVGPGALTELQRYCALVQAHPRSYKSAPCRAHVETLDMGAGGSIAIGTDGFPVISYFGSGATPAKVARCLDPVCAANTSHTFDTVADETSLAIGADGNPVVAYHGPAGALKVARCGDPACAASTLNTLDTIAGSPFSSIAIGTDGLPVVSYRGNGLVVAHCNDPACATSTLNTVDTSAFFTSIAIGTDGNPVISYQGPGGLTVARCGDRACTTHTEHTLDTSGISTSIAIGTDGHPVVVHRHSSGFLRVAHCLDPACASRTLRTMDAGQGPSIAIGTDGFPVISYQSSSDRLNIADCSDAACSGFFTVIGETGFGPISTAIGTDGSPIVAYQGLAGTQKVVRPPVSG